MDDCEHKDKALEGLEKYMDKEVYVDLTGEIKRAYFVSLEGDKRALGNCIGDIERVTFYRYSDGKHLIPRGSYLLTVYKIRCDELGLAGSAREYKLNQNRLGKLERHMILEFKTTPTDEKVTLH
jgi:hypothetical protein